MGVVEKRAMSATHKSFRHRSLKYGGMQVKREHWLDVCKGYLIILVVMGHVVSAFQSAGIYVDNQFFSFVHSFAYSFHMATFFFLSGYIYCHFENNGLTVGKKIIKRLVAYGIPYIIFSIIYCIMKLLLSSYTNSSVTYKDFVCIPVKPLGYLWFVYALMIMEIVQDLMSCVREKNKKSIKRDYCLICVAVILANIQFYCSIKFGETFTDDIFSDFMRMWVYFLLGVFFGTTIVKYLFSLHRKTVLSLFVILIGTNVLLLNNIVTKRWIMVFVMAILGITISVYFSKKLNSNRVLEFLGRMCFPIYLLHDYVLVLCRIIVLKSHMEYIWGVVFIGSSLLALLLPIAFYIVMKKYLNLDIVFYPGKYFSTQRRK